jgi:hypothetical protein
MLKTDLEALHELAAAAPSFQPEWDEDDPIPYVDIGDLVRHLRERLKCGEIEEVRAVFDLADSLLGNDEVEPGFIKIGLFESIQNTSPGTGLDQEEWEPFLGTQSRQLWGDLNQMWGGSTADEG